MDRNDVMDGDLCSLAKAAGFEFGENSDGLIAMCSPDAFYRFAELVAAREREACAKVCDSASSDDPLDSIAPYCADVIRARGKQE